MVILHGSNNTKRVRARATRALKPNPSALRADSENCARASRARIHSSLMVSCSLLWSERALRAHSNRAVRAKRGRRQVTCDKTLPTDCLMTTGNSRSTLSRVKRLYTSLYQPITSYERCIKKQKRTNKRGRTTRGVPSPCGIINCIACLKSLRL